MNQLSLAPTLVLAVAIGIVVIGVAGALVWRQRRKPEGASPAEDPLAPDDAVALDDGGAVEIGETVAADWESAEVAETVESDVARKESTFAPPPIVEAPAPEATVVEAPVMELPMEPPPPAAVAADHSVPARVSFHLHLPTQGHARSAGQIARRDGYTADVQPPVAEGAMWTCVLTREMPPSPAAIEEERVFLSDLAEAFGGRVERWETRAAG